MTSTPYDPFAYLIPYAFVLLTTFRQQGQAVATPMWFAYDNGKLYMVTQRTAGKLKHIRHTNRVLLASCDVAGKVLGPSVEAVAHELPMEHHVTADVLLAKKYGEEYEMSSAEGNTVEETYIEVEPIQQSA